MVITLNKEEVRGIIRNYLKEHYVPKYPNKWINFVIHDGKVIIGITDDAESAGKEAVAEANRDRPW